MHLRNFGMAEQVYELSTGIKRNTLLGHYNTVTCCIYSENSKFS